MNIEFKYSYLYDQHLKFGDNFVDPNKVQKSIRQLDNFWRVNEKKIVNAFKQIIGLEFKTEKLICYVNSSSTFSDPLSLRHENLNDMQNNLIHELIHIILTQNECGKWSGWKDMNTKYQKYTGTTRTHIAIHAIHLLINKNIFPRRIAAIKNYSKWPEYIESWRIVESDGADHILSMIFKK